MSVSLLRKLLVPPYTLYSDERHLVFVILIIFSISHSAWDRECTQEMPVADTDNDEFETSGSPGRALLCSNLCLGFGLSLIMI